MGFVLSAYQTLVYFLFCFSLPGSPLLSYFLSESQRVFTKCDELEMTYH